jgi:pSer/pThr/pTyr-binding forkhead associated (FHA) protein
MDLLGKARRLESTVAARIDEAAKGLVRSRSRPRESLEIVHAILDAVDQEIEPTGRGTRVFPFNRIDVSLVAPSHEARARLEAVFAGEMPLRTRILERLRSAGCPPADIVVAIEYVDRAYAKWRAPEFDLRFARVAEPPVESRERESPARIEITVLRGVTERRAYSLAAGRIDMGRGAEVRDTRQRLIRTNHVVFTDGSADVNQTVSRQHAHVTCEPHTGHFRLHDDGSGHGTGIVRHGRTISVPRGARGVRLQSEDEIVLGEARVRIRIQKR